jgi:putative flippase GtrA
MAGRGELQRRAVGTARPVFHVDRRHGCRKPEFPEELSLEGCMSKEESGTMLRTATELMRYCLVGGCGFFVEAAVIGALQYGFQWSALPCRAVSFPTAVLVTWWLNHRFTFGSRGGWAELARYLGTQGIGLLTNLAAYVGVIRLFPELDRQALVPLVVGSALGLVVNFVLAKRLVFIRPKQ